MANDVRQQPPIALGQADGELRGLGQYLRLRPYWTHEQLEPYLPERRDIYMLLTRRDQR